MNKIIRCLVKVLFLCLFSSSAMAQFRKMAVGDKMPDVELQNIINYKTSKAKITDFKGKLILLDFWATWCTPCVALIPKMDSLQKEFKGKLQIIPVTEERENKVKSFFKRMNHVLPIQPLSVTGDTILKTFFNYGTLPYYVWINGDGIIVGITESNEVTAKNIKELLGGSTPAFSMKSNALNKSMDINTPAFALNLSLTEDNKIVNEPLVKDKLFYHSVATGCLVGVHGFFINEPGRFTSINFSVAATYKLVYGSYGLKYFSVNRTIFNIKDTILYHKLTSTYLDSLNSEKAYLDWMKYNAVCYEIQLPDSVEENRKQEIIKQDLDRCFGSIYNIEAKIEDRAIKSLILIRTSKEDKLATKGNDPVEQYNAYWYSLHNQPINIFINRLAYFFQSSSYPVVNETNYLSNVDLELNCKMSDVNAINGELEKYGLKLIEENRVVDVLVIKDR